MSTIKTTTLSTQGGSTVPVETVVNGTAKAWVNFNGTGTVAIRRAFNVSSITDNGVGRYSINLTTAMPDANYAVMGHAIADSSYPATVGSYNYSRSVGSFGFSTSNGSNVWGPDCGSIDASIFS